MKPKRERPPTPMVLWDEEWEVIPPMQPPPFDTLDTLERIRGVAVIRYTYSKASGKPPEYRISAWAGDLGSYAPDTFPVYATELEARRAFVEVIAEMKKPLPRYFAET